MKRVTEIPGLWTNTCAVCGQPCIRGWYERDLIALKTATELGATLKDPGSLQYHRNCLYKVRAWIYWRTKQNDRPTP